MTRERGKEISHAVKAAVIFTAIAAILSIGCVSEDTYAELENKYRELQTENAKLKADAAAFQSGIEDRNSTIQNLNSELAAIRAAQQKPADTSDLKIDDPDITINTMTNALMISDSLLFASGSSALKEDAKKTLEKLVPILNSPAHAKAFIRIDGHTDDQPVVKTKAINEDNWKLSGLRAHAVMKKLVELGVERDRFICCAYGSILPVEPNEPGGKGNSKNRRVEIMLIDNPAGIEKK